MGFMPTYEISSFDCGVKLPVSVKRPSISVATPVRWPLTRTLAPMAGSPSLSSTVPVTVVRPLCEVSESAPALRPPPRRFFDSTMFVPSKA